MYYLYFETKHYAICQLNSTLQIPIRSGISGRIATLKHRITNVKTLSRVSISEGSNTVVINYYDFSENCFDHLPTYESLDILQNNRYHVMFVKNTKDLSKMSDKYIGHFRKEIRKNSVLANHRARINWFCNFNIDRYCTCVATRYRSYADHYLI